MSYACAPWEPVDWQPFDIAAIDAYRDADNVGTFRDQLRRQLGHGKPLVVTEFGCACYAGAGDRGGMGWAIVDETTDPPQLDGDYVRDETEQVRYLRELHQIFTEEGADLAFWHAFACYEAVHRSQPRHDLDLASFGVVRMLDTGPGTGYQGLGWEPKLAFTALAELSQASAARLSRVGVLRGVAGAGRKARDGVRGDQAEDLARGGFWRPRPLRGSLR